MKREVRQKMPILAECFRARHIIIAPGSSPILRSYIGGFCQRCWSDGHIGLYLRMGSACCRFAMSVSPRCMICCMRLFRTIPFCGADVLSGSSTYTHTSHAHCLHDDSANTPTTRRATLEGKSVARLASEDPLNAPKASVKRSGPRF